MIFRVIPFILILCIGCKTAPKIAQMRIIAEDNKDVVVLSYLIRDYMRKTNNISFTLEDILKYDTLRQITKNFSKLEIDYWPNIWRGGYLVYFKFADSRNKDSVKLAQYEGVPWTVKTKKEIGSSKTQRANKFDGEIHFYYPERHYYIKEIIVK